MFSLARLSRSAQTALLASAVLVAACSGAQIATDAGGEGVTANKDSWVVDGDQVPIGDGRPPAVDGQPPLLTDGPLSVTDSQPPPPATVCGNGKKEGSEQCDDGNTVDYDGCSSLCYTQTPYEPHFEFGGLIGTGSSNYPHPVTGTMTCPQGFSKQQVLGTTQKDWNLWVCLRPYDPQNRYMSFGGMYGRYAAAGWHANPATGQASCPSGYTDRKVLGTASVDWELHYCYRLETGAPGAPRSIHFGGLYSGKAGFTSYGNPALNPPSAACTSGYAAAQVFGGASIDSALTVCIMHGLGHPPELIKKTLWVSRTGSGDGSSAAPASLQGVPALAAAAARAGGAGTVQVLLEGGRYYLREPWRLTPKHSGTDQSPIVYRPRPGATAVLDGSIAFDATHCAWSAVPGKSYMRCTFTNATTKQGVVAALKRIKAAGANDGGFTFTELYIKSVRGTRARHPNVAVPFRSGPYLGWTGPRRPRIDLPASCGIGGQLPAGLASGQVEAVFGKRWQQHRARITSTCTPDASTGLPYCVEMGHLQIAYLTPVGDVDERAYLENHLAFLDQPGEWFIDEADPNNPLLYYYPRSGEGLADASTTFQLPVVGRLLTLDGAATAGANTADLGPVQNLRFEGLHFRFARWDYRAGTPVVASQQASHSSSLGACAQRGAIEGKGVRNVVVRGCDFRKLGAFGISLGDGRDFDCGRKVGFHTVAVSPLRHVVLQGNTLTELGGGAIRLSGFGHEGTTPLMDATLYNNGISSVGRVFADGAAIYLAGSDGRVLNNTVSDTTYSGIIGYSVCRIAGRRVSVFANKVDRTMRRLLDGGGIYVFGLQGAVVNNTISATGTDRFADAMGVTGKAILHPDLYFDGISRNYYAAGNRSTPSTARLSLLFKSLTHQIEGISNCVLTCPGCAATDRYQCMVSSAIYGSNVTLMPPTGYDTVEAADQNVCP